jgi:hypothetical protein
MVLYEVASVGGLLIYLKVPAPFHPGGSLLNLGVAPLRVINFAQTHPDNSPHIPSLLIRLGDYGNSEE